MNKMKLSIQKYGQFIKFCIVGASNTIISLAIYYFLLKLGIHYILASTVAYCAGIINGYIFSSSFVFKKERNLVQAIKFIATYLSSLLINLLILYILVNGLKISEFLAQLMVTFFNVIYNFLLQKLWTFK
ncbi:GtrA family protein [Neobacillus terrae]|uniref:GtrA family protein n=1 Tax=Neobacillus terrae TaxID=3034837 RepID=UPI00140B746D|nr:GtrA family protein [Neobacillus terrae]NHM30004.1 GtrA family protein [Neobacillus terrae]